MSEQNSESPKASVKERLLDAAAKDFADEVKEGAEKLFGNPADNA